MMSLGRKAVYRPGLVICCFALVCACLTGFAGQQFSAQAQAPTAPAATQTAPAASMPPTEIHGVIRLEGPWRFQAGDDPRWADPAFDDSTWPTVSISKSLVDQGIDPFSGYAWYRLKLDTPQLAQLNALTGGQEFDLMIASASVGQLAVFVDGVELGHSRGMTDNPTMFKSPPFTVHVPAAGTKGARVLAIRSWAGPGITVKRGLVEVVTVGTAEDIASRLDMATGRQWDSELASMVLSFLFFCVAGLGASLYLAQRHHSEYLWLALLCLSVAMGGVNDVLFGLAISSVFVHYVFAIFLGHIFMVVTLEFILRFTGSDQRRIVRGMQIAFLLLPFVSLVHLDKAYQYLAVAAEVVFCGTVIVLLFRAWRNGHRDSGVMLVPFFLAATADSIDTLLDWAASMHWLPDQFASHRFHMGPVEFGTGTVTYAVFLGSLIAVILYRFVRVSQDEQKSAAEISAARSVQALLIPTQLPSSRNFMLESAYLPVNGVGGDFFQVLPLKDDSLLIVVGDVSGKGLQAAMSSSTLVGALRNELSHDPATILDHLNRVLLGAVASPGKLPGLDSAPAFATCLCARIYPDGSLTIANAGHLSPYRDGRELQLEPNLPLGVIADARYEQTSFQLEKGDRLVFLSDGVVEATNAQGELFGFERTQQVANEPARYIAQTAKHFGQTDDITVVSVYFSSRTAKKNSEEKVLAS
jgi:hypothetical protein